MTFFAKMTGSAYFCHFSKIIQVYCQQNTPLKAVCSNYDVYSQKEAFPAILAQNVTSMTPIKIEFYVEQHFQIFKKVKN